MQPTKKKKVSNRSQDCKKGSSSMSEKQRNLMLEFLSENPSMIRDRSVGGTSNKPDRDELWEKLACVLNSCGSGAQKDGGGWRRSWQDLKRYESLKAKESMARLGKFTKLQEPPTISLSPLQEKIATLLNISIKDMAESVDLSSLQVTQDTLSDPNQCTSTVMNSKQQIKPEHIPGSTQGENVTEVNIAQALNSIAVALTERNAIEEKKLRVFENLLTVFAAKNGIAMTEAHDLD